MKVCNSFGSINGQSYIVESNEIVAEISQSFIDITGYSAEELLNKSIKELFSILRIGPDFDIRNIDGGKDYFLFTKLLDARFINITVTDDMLEKVYVFSEKSNSSLDVKFPSV